MERNTHDLDAVVRYFQEDAGPKKIKLGTVAKPINITHKNAAKLLQCHAALNRAVRCPRKKPMRWKGRDSATKFADKLWADAIHAQRWCFICHHEGKLNETNCEAHHVAGRSKRFRWRVELGMLLCPWHHRNSPLLSAHGAPKVFKAWLLGHFPQIAEANYEVETAEQAIERLSA